MKDDKNMISVVIPVLDEGGIINEILNHINTISCNIVREIIIVDGDSSGSTICEVKAKSVITLVSGKGRAKQMNAGARLAGGNVIMFLHADTVLPANAFVEIQKTMQCDEFVAGAFDLGIDNNNFVFKLIASAASLKHRLTHVPFGDQAIFIRREYFEAMGGYKEIPLMEDVDLMKRIKKKGWNIRIIPSKVLTSARKWEKEGVAYTVIRNWMIQILYLFGMSPERLVRYYYKY